MKKKRFIKTPSILFPFLFLLLYFSPVSLYAQAGTVKGMVKDYKGQSLPGVSITQKGTGNATTSGNDGSFTINIPDGSILVFSHVGYDSKEIQVNGTNAITINLSSKESILNDVVVIGYGRQQRRDLTGSVATVSSGQIKDIPVGSIDQKLIGQVSGVHITSPTGAPGGGPDIKIRGSGSIGAGDNPLFVIDGYPLSNTNGQSYNPLNLISPDDIESITVLKDASSTAIYGSRGANGVIVITTRKGKSGIPTVSVNAYAGVQQVPQKGRPQVLNGQEYAQFQKDRVIDDFISRGLVATDNDIPMPYRNPAQYGEGTDWYETVLQDAVMHNIDASLSGGSENTQYSVSLGRMKQEGVIRYTDFERYSVRANVESAISKKFKVGLTLAPSGSVQNRNDFNTGFRDVLTRALWLSPIVPVTDASGNRTIFITSPGAIGAGNPLNTLEFASTKAKYFRGLASAFAEFKIMNGLRARYSFNIDYANNSSFVFRPSFVIGETGNPNPNLSTPSSSTGSSTNLNWLSELTVNYDKDFGMDHRINALVGYTAQKERSEGYNFNATNYPDNLIETINASALLNGAGAGIEKWSLLSYLARVNYTYKGKYLFTATIRTDGSSRFGANKRYGTFPSGAIAWRVSDEEFLKDITWINSLKLRASYGRSGNFNIGNYSYSSNISGANYSFGGQLANGRVSTSISNRDLTWETSDELDIGMDLTVLKNRLNLTFDFYNRITTGMLYNSEIPFSSGFGSSLINEGKIRNRGFEFGFTSNNLIGEFTWNSNFNISFNRNEVLALNDDNNPIYSGRSGEGNFTHKTEVGKPIGQFFGYLQEGLYRNEADLNSSPKHNSSVVGSIKYRDINKDGQILPFSDFTVIGNSQPDFIYGLSNSFGYKGFDLNILVVGSQGGQIMKTGNEFSTNIDGVFNVDKKILNRWRSEANPGDGMTPTTNGARVIYRDVNSSWIEDASYLRIQNVALGYTFKQRFITNSRIIKGLRLYGSVQNLAIFTDYTGANPEASTNGSSVLTPGRDFTNYPLPRILTVGLN
ncbi:MAG TPA: TonB-dependent receptor, partial [Chitinophagaceae bacterium]|nr:TonB-dependent receptor [Chitinophagaceae bacterium]